MSVTAVNYRLLFPIEAHLSGPEHEKVPIFDCACILKTLVQPARFKCSNGVASAACFWSVFGNGNAETAP